MRLSVTHIHMSIRVYKSAAITSLDVCELTIRVEVRGADCQLDVNHMSHDLLEILHPI